MFLCRRSGSFVRAARCRWRVFESLISSEANGDAPLLVHRAVSGELQRQQALVDRGGRGDAGERGEREKGDDVQAPAVKAAKQPVEVVLLATASPGRRVRPW
jgi:hypothetical protein